MATIEDKIETALFTYTEAAIVELDVPPELAMPNRPFPESGDPADKPDTFVEVKHLPNNNTRLYLKGSNPHHRQGILQFTVVTPLNDTNGHAPATALASAIAEMFPADMPLYEDGIKVTVQKAPDVGQADKSEDLTRWEARVSVYYECFA